MRDVAIVGVGMTKFGRLSSELDEMISKACLGAMDDCGNPAVESVYVANMGAGAINHQTALASAVIDRLGLLGKTSAVAVENGPASGQTAAKLGFFEVASGYSDCVMVAGGERMRVASGGTITDFVAMMSHPQAEYIHGVTLPSLAGMFARLYMDTYGITSEDLANIAVKNHANGMLNPYAHIHQKITLEGILLSREAKLNNPVIADPLRLYDMCPVSDGAAAFIICPLDKAKEFCDTPVRIAGVGQGTDLHAVHERPEPLVLKSVREAADRAFTLAEIERKDIDFLELHDAFTILEFAESENAGFFEPGKCAEALREGVTQIGGKLPINPSGGLKARGHPVGATGAAQLVECTWQLRGDAGERQVDGAERAFTVNFGGFGNNVVAHILERGD